VISIDLFEELPPMVGEQFQRVAAQLRAFLGREHNDDGTHVIAVPQGTVPVGGTVPFAGPLAPAGWLLCDGGLYNRITYKSLFEVVGTTYGPGDGSTTFAIPDMRGAFPLGKAAAGTGSALGATGGALDHTHTFGGHTHSITASGDHSHGGNTGSAGAHSHTVDAHNHTFSTSTGTPSDGVDVQSGTGSTAASTSHTHGVDGDTSDESPATNTQGDHSHSIGNSGNHDHGGTTGTASGATGSANPPFIALNFIIYAGV
jgi:microcystin-dependent protein